MDRLDINSNFFLNSICNRPYMNTHEDDDEPEPRKIENEIARLSKGPQYGGVVEPVNAHRIRMGSSCKKSQRGITVPTDALSGSSVRTNEVLFEKRTISVLRRREELMRKEKVEKEEKWNKK